LAALAAATAEAYSVPNLAHAIGVNLTRRMAPAAVPVLGVALGAAVNAAYLSDLTGAARCVFRERWLAEKYPEIRFP
jgi:hypothetical protein